ncbi:hypothetical protein CR205_17720 [Alteribacter lacisalsi]|uniref:Uncharacterized protein n=1 Tax=Alteribacter lacisalsi TaxID=2045244 RepID=A0A2W0H596_9BACI|nr:hypothetical protein [Alteribacter lacisalsi]PYZ96201.1 hypothetical protein CR205_17720 [Alteribacter lacisalsi]
MFFEHYHELVPILLSLSIYVAVAGAHLISVTAQELVIRSRYTAGRRLADGTAGRELPEGPSAFKEERQSWLTRMMKRKDAPEDDTDYFSFSLEKMNESEEDIYGKNICVYLSSVSALTGSAATGVSWRLRSIH